MINTKLFQENWKEIQEKLEEINKIPRLRGVGNTFRDIEVEEEGLRYNTETFFCGDTDYYSLFVKWEEINEPIEYFQKKFQKEIEDFKKEQEQRKKDNAKKQKKEQEDRDKKVLKKLIDKYGIPKE